jgi:heterodisulfide reductase subunit C
MDYLREKSLAIKDHGPGVDDIILFHKLLLEEVYKRGRVSETALALKFNMQTGQYFKDAGLGQKLLRKGKISPFSSKVRDLNKVRSFFKQEPDRREV